MSVKIYGYGWVGKAVKDLFPDAVIQDPSHGFMSEEKCDVGFVCVPSPCPNKGALDCSIIEDVVRNAPEDFLIIRSTVNPGTTDKLIRETGKQIVMMPEFLGETVNHPMLDETQRTFLILGGEPVARRKAIELFTTVYNANTNIRQCSALEAEVIKLSENRAIGYKVAQCQELYDACQSAGVDYYTIRDAVYGDDPRFNLWWTFILPGKRGFNSKCIPKDIYAWRAWASDSELTDALLKYNERLLDAVDNNSE
jgi:UDPglucose 6-dehydrogenase